MPTTSPSYPDLEHPSPIGASLPRGPTPENVVALLAPSWVKRAQDTVVAAEDWFGSHLDDQPSLVDVANAVDTSVSHLRRLFHSVRGESPREALQRIWLERAKLLLVSGRPERLEDVALACGYSDLSAFSRAFKRASGQAPSTWRRIRRSSGTYRVVRPGG